MNKSKSSVGSAAVDIFCKERMGRDKLIKSKKFLGDAWYFVIDGEEIGL